MTSEATPSELRGDHSTSEAAEAAEEALAACCTAKARLEISCLVSSKRAIISASHVLLPLSASKVASTAALQSSTTSAAATSSMRGPRTPSGARIDAAEPGRDLAVSKAAKTISRQRSTTSFAASMSLRGVKSMDDATSVAPSSRRKVSFSSAASRAALVSAKKPTTGGTDATGAGIGASNLSSTAARQRSMSSAAKSSIERGVSSMSTTLGVEETMGSLDSLAAALLNIRSSVSKSRAPKTAF
mmetsp:Transcript_11156/g.39505  ORF Transcript_11156/g.39505 Transcript_11156/m.39505 type:complete len:244 (-) Transcript_11156:860-1591(-)